MASLEALAGRCSAADELRVPAWTLGCFVRRSISYADGSEDGFTKVVWTQAHGMTGDLRIPANRPRVVPGDRPGDMDRATLARLASVEGAIGGTHWAGGTMSWNWWCSYQPYDKWPEPAQLRRVGTALIEFAPSGIYVEDWRLQPSRGGAVAGLRLIAESGKDGALSPRDGGLVVAGDHALLCLARRQALPDGARAQDVVRDAADPLLAYLQVADCVADYAVEGTIAASTDPWREGTALDLEGFEPAGEGTLRQSLMQDGAPIERIWRVVSLGLRDGFPAETAASPERFAWLEREADTLRADRRMAACAW